MHINHLCLDVWRKCIFDPEQQHNYDAIMLWKINLDEWLNIPFWLISIGYLCVDMESALDTLLIQKGSIRLQDTAVDVIYKTLQEETLRLSVSVS